MASCAEPPPEEDWEALYADLAAWDYYRRQQGLFVCRCVECDEHFEAHTPDLICGRCDYLQGLPEEERDE